jgi:1-acyl-sn-glycerol-3-phosphate acyltransferase
MKASLQYKTGRILLYLIFKILFGLKREGFLNVPKEGSVIIAPNHRSNYDPPIVGCCIDSREIYFLAKSGLFISKIATWFLSGLNTIPVDLKSPGIGTMKRFIELLRDGKAIMIFPEGTRSKTGEYLRAKTGVGYLAIKTNSPVIPTLIEGTFESMTNHLLRKTPLRVKFGNPIYPSKEVESVKDANLLSKKILKEIKKLG